MGVRLACCSCTRLGKKEGDFRLARVPTAGHVNPVHLMRDCYGNPVDLIRDCKVIARYLQDSVLGPLFTPSIL